MSSDRSLSFPGFSPPKAFPLADQMDKALVKAMPSLQAEAATILGSRGFTAMREDEASKGVLVHAARWQDQDIMSNAPELAELTTRPGLAWSRACLNVTYVAMLPGAMIAPRTGLSNHMVLRYCLPVIAPLTKEFYLSQASPAGKQHVHHWRQGKAIIFDGAYEHWGRNGTKQVRLLVQIDMIRDVLGEKE